MKMEGNVWQRVPGTTAVDIFPIITRPSIISSNCYIVAGPQAILVIDPGASPEQTQHVSHVVSGALARSQRPVLVFLTHCHQDHSQEAGSLRFPRI
jgi:glyoxylase-like metal-dependent hydrolase (beta-lactamase superfamily II)